MAETAKKIHIGKNGPDYCEAEEKDCPLGGVHYSSMVEADTAYQEQLRTEAGGTFQLLEKEQAESKAEEIARKKSERAQREFQRSASLDDAAQRKAVELEAERARLQGIYEEYVSDTERYENVLQKETETLRKATLAERLNQGLAGVSTVGAVGGMAAVVTAGVQGMAAANLTFAQMLGTNQFGALFNAASANPALLWGGMAVAAVGVVAANVFRSSRRAAKRRVTDAKLDKQKADQWVEDSRKRVQAMKDRLDSLR